MAGKSLKATELARDDPDTPSIDVISLLGDERRRYVLSCLLDHTDPMGLADLAEEIAVHENEGPIDDIPRESLQRIEMSLYHAHIPKLVDAGVVEYDNERDLIRESDPADRIERALSLVGSSPADAASD